MGFFSPPKLPAAAAAEPEPTPEQRDADEEERRRRRVALSGIRTSPTGLQQQEAVGRSRLLGA